MNAHSLNKSVFRLLAGVSALPLLSLAAQADDTPQTLPPMVVTATRIPTPEDELGSSVTVVTAADIERKQERTLPDVLRDIPGLNLVQTGGVGGTTSVFIRGTNANHTKVLIDGIEASDPSQVSGAFDFAHILASDIERVEVLRGPQSGLYGSDAIGGVVNIITKSGSGPLKLKASIEGGSFDTFNQAGSASGSSGRVDYTFNIGHVRAESTPVTPLNLLPPGRQANDNFYDNKTVSSKLGLAVTDNADLGFVLRYVDTQLRSTGDDFSTFPSTPSATQDLGTTHQLFTRATGHLSSFDGRFDQTLGAAYTLYDHSDFFFGSGLSLSHGDRFKVDWQGNLTLMKGEVVTLGAESEKEHLEAPPTTAETTTNAGFLQLQSNIGEHFFNTVSLRLDSNDHYGNEATYRVAPAWHVGDWGTILKGSVGTGFKAPSLNELFVNFPAFGFFGNPNLKPERSFGYDLGFDQPALAGKVKFGATWFHNDIDNLIQANFTTSVNIAKAETSGVESYATWQPMERLALRADYTFTRAEDEILHQELLLRPKHKASLNGSWQATDKLTLSATYIYVGASIDGNRDFSVARENTSSYGLINLAAAYDLGHGVTAFGRIDNALDRRYENPPGFQRPGFGVFAGVKVAFDTGLGGPQPRQGATKKAE